MVVLFKDLWTLVNHQQHLDPQDLLEAIQAQVQSGDLDHRTRLLIRDSVAALKKHLGPERLSAWLESCPVREKIDAICREEFDDEVGFPSLMRRVMDITRPETILQYFRELGAHVKRPIHMNVGGCVPLILGGLVARKTEDIDVVDEIPAELRGEYKLLDDLARRYNLELTHFQHHYLPSGWEGRLRSLEPIGGLRISLVDPYDVFLSKLSSVREKDFDDLRAVAPQLDKDRLVRLLKETMQATLALAELRERAAHNWYVLFGEQLPA